MYLTPSYHKTTSPKDLMRVVDGMANIIRTWVGEQPFTVSHMVVTGASGQSIAWPVSYKIGLPVAIARKPNENAHTGEDLVGTGQLTDYIILDDLIGTGSTIHRMLRSISKQAKERGVVVPKCRAIFLYYSGHRTPYADSSDSEPIPVFGTNLVEDY